MCIGTKKAGSWKLEAGSWNPDVKPGLRRLEAGRMVGDAYPAGSWKKNTGDRRQG